MLDKDKSKFVPFKSPDFDADEIVAEMQQYVDDGIRLYRDLIRAGVMKQQAISILPFAIYAPNLPIKAYEAIYSLFLEYEKSE